MAVTDVFDYLGGGMSLAEVLDDFPDLTADDIQACFAFAARLSLNSELDHNGNVIHR